MAARFLKVPGTPRRFTDSNAHANLENGPAILMGLFSGPGVAGEQIIVSNDANGVGSNQILRLELGATAVSFKNRILCPNGISVRAAGVSVPDFTIVTLPLSAIEGDR